MDIILGVVMFTLIVLVLVLIILLAKAKLVASGDVKITINNDADKTITAHVGDKLLDALSSNGIFIPSACGGTGSCGQCKCNIISGGGEILPTETAHITKKEARQGERLACQVKVKQDLNIKLPPDIFGAKKWECKVISNNNVATFIKELILEIPNGEDVPFRAGGYVQIEAPAHIVKYSDFKIEAEYLPDWEKYNLFRYESIVTEPVTRAYSMASYPLERGIIKLNVRIATPPPRMPDVPPGLMSSYIWSLEPGDTCTISGPFGEFFAKETEAEMIFVGGGAGMAPMRSHIFDQLLRLNSTRKISFWYGARSRQEMFYVKDFDSLAAKYPNFTWHVALSDAKDSDNWEGYTGFIHNVLYEHYLKDHYFPEDCEYYLCGPPIMNKCVTEMLQNLGVEDENIMFDDFG